MRRKLSLTALTAALTLSGVYLSPSQAADDQPLQCEWKQNPKDGFYVVICDVLVDSASVGIDRVNRGNCKTIGSSDPRPQKFGDRTFWVTFCKPIEVDFSVDGAIWTYNFNG